MPPQPPLERTPRKPGAFINPGGERRCRSALQLALRFANNRPQAADSLPFFEWHATCKKRSETLTEDSMRLGRIGGAVVAAGFIAAFATSANAVPIAAGSV